ncbi:MAG: hypothetical protein JXB50_04270 [Spirochaetes bacterium]|nr:hypothetical protein [Spirochaetota bacterium]
MAVTSVRFNKNEEKILNYLKNHFHCDASTLVKKSLYELYEDLKDKEIIEKFEDEENNKKIHFNTIDNILK